MAYANGGSPLASLIEKKVNGTIYFASASKQTAAWAAWVRRTFA